MKWPEIEFGQAIQMFSGKTPSKANPEFWDGNIPWITASSMTNLFVSNSIEKITEKSLVEAGMKYIPKQTPLLLVRGSMLHQRIPICIPTVDVTINQDVKALKVIIPELDNDFFIAWLLASEKLLLEKVEFTGIGAGKLDTGVLNKLKIPLPDLATQKKIGKFISNINNKIELNNQMNQTLDGIARSVFKEWFIDFGPVRAKLQGHNPPCMDKETANDFPSSFVESTFGMIPEGWNVLQLSELCELTSSKRIMASEYVKSGVPFFRSKEVINKANRQPVQTELFISDERYEEIKSKFDIPKKNDLLITSVGTLGRVYRVLDSDKFYFKDGNLIWFKPKKDELSSLLYYFLTSDKGKEELSKTAIGSTQPAYTIFNLSKIKILTPPLQLLEKFHLTVEALENLLNNNILETQGLKDLRENLLPELLYGSTEQ